MQHISQQLIRIFADGQQHSAEQLAAHTGLQLAAIPNEIQTLNQHYGLNIQQSATNFRLDIPLNLLDKSTILSYLSDTQRAVLQQCQLSLSTASTNTLALQNPPDPHHAAVWLTEFQSAGRGRRGRQWVGGFARQLQCSLVYTFRLPTQQLSGLSIAVGAVLAERLNHYQVPDLSLKWPNDIHCQGQKIAGILLEVQGNTAGPVSAVIGIGLNLLPDASVEPQIKQPFTNLHSLGIQLDRNRLAGELIHDLINLCQAYPTTGLAPYLALWQDYDHWQGQPVTLTGPQHQQQGQYVGLDDEGHLLLQVGSNIQRYHAGELSLRQT